MLGGSSELCRKEAVPFDNNASASSNNAAAPLAHFTQMIKSLAQACCASGVSKPP
jgi:hypothetical protein